MVTKPFDLPDFRPLFEATPGLYLILDPDLTIIAVNDAYCRATMTVREQILGRGIFDVFPDNPDDPNADGVRNLRVSLDRVRQFRQADAMAVQRYDVRKPESEGGGFEERHWSPLNTPVLDAQQRVRWIIHRVEDVTQLVRLQVEGEAREKLTREQQLLIMQLRRANEELAGKIDEIATLDADRQRIQDELLGTRNFLDLVVENIPAMLFVKDAKELRFVLMNRAGEELLGYNRRELIGKNDYDFFPKEQADFFTAQDREVLSPGALRVIPEEPVATRHKGTRYLQTKKMPVFDADGQPAYLLGLSEDITDRKVAEHQLRQAVKMEAMGQLTGGVAHDFNNLLTVILSNAETLVEEIDDPGLRSLAEMTRMAAERGAELTNSLLAFARRQPLEPQAVNINKLVAGMDGLLRRALGEHVEIEFVQAAGLWKALIDPGQLESAILNLSLNARDAMPEGGRLTIETGNVRIDQNYSDAHDEVAPGQYVLIGVSDTGTGMTPEIQARAFDPFFSTKEVGKGTGLGLSMVYGFVKQSGGHIKIYSEMGHGTLFKLYLPRAMEAQHHTISEPVQKLEDPTGNETILLVEDDDLVREHAERSLRALGYRVLTANTGASAIKILERIEAIDLLFTDVVMPGGMGGRQLADAAAALRPSLKILFTSGYTENAIVHHGRLDVGVHLIRKPYRRRDLALKLRQLLDTDSGAKR